MNQDIMKNIRARKPRIHSITNTITINDCANIILAAGGSATMAADPQEAAEMTAQCDGLVLNLGAVSSLEAMLQAGYKAGALHHPIVFDPVAAGATALRRHAARQLIEELPITAIRGNATEICALASLSAPEEENENPSPDSGSESFVDAPAERAMQKKNLPDYLKRATFLSEKTHATVVVSGPEDLIVSGGTYTLLSGGSSFSARITGTGCMLSELIATSLAANPEKDRHEVICTAVEWMNRAAENAENKMHAEHGGTMTFRMHLIDEISLS